MIGMILIGVTAGIINVLLSLVINQFTSGNKADEVAISTYALNLFVGWVLFSAWFLTKVDEEWKKVQEAIARKDKTAFKIEAPKRIPPSIRALYFMISMLVVLSTPLFHIENVGVLWVIQFGTVFLVVMTIQVMLDLDDPTHGVVNVPNIPEEWLEELNKDR